MSEPTPPAKDRVGIWLPPPVYPLAGLVLSWVAQGLVPLPAVPTIARWAGDGLAVLCVAYALWAVAALFRHDTPLDPYRATTAIVDDGPYAWGRNPIYLAFTVATAALGLAFGWWWALAAAPLVGLALHRRVVRREEAYLAGKFGASYLEYKARVRRWL